MAWWESWAEKDEAPGSSSRIYQALQAFLKLLRKLTVFFFSSVSLLSARRFRSSYLGD
jgi:hypothetical protein